MEQVDSVRSEMDELSSVCEASTDLLNETPPVDEGAAVPMPTLDEILEKDKFSAVSAAGTK